jgi:hypothetical protein
MNWIRVLCSGCLAAIMLMAVNSCGVPAPTIPTATAVVPVDASTINNSDPIVIAFSSSMNPGALTLSGDMASQSDRGVWSKTRQTNDTLTISPSAASGDVWTEGPHTLIIDVESTNSVPLSTITLNYTVAAVVPTASIVAVNVESFIGSDIIIIFFSVAMDPSTLILTGDMAAESNGGIWATTINENDILVVSPSNVWSGNANTLIINVDSAAGVSLPTLTLNYAVDISVPVAIASPADSAVINNSTPIVIYFSVAMEPATLVLAGTLAIESDDGVWSTNRNTNDVLTISPSGAWTEAAHTLIIDVDASNSIPLSTLALNYTVDVTLPTASVAPGTNSFITGGEPIVINFDESMDIATLVAAGTLWEKSDNGVWSTVTNSNDKLTVSPATSWPAGGIDFTLDIVDLVGNSIAPLNLNYTVDVIAPNGAATPASGSLLSSADNVVISFSESMATNTLSYAGTLFSEVGESNWTNTGGNIDDTLTIGASTFWSTGEQTLDVTVEDVAGNVMVLNLTYTVVQ